MFEQRVDMPNHAQWPTITLENLCEVISRGKGPRYVEASTVNAIGQRCITDKGFDPSLSRPHDDKVMGGHLIPAEGDVLLNSTGTGTIGRSSVFDGHGKFIVDSHVTLLRPRKNQVDPGWLNELLRNPRFQRHLEANCYTGSTNQLELSRSQLMKASVPTPSHDEQRLIASLLDTLDTQIQKTEALIAKLEKVKEGLLHDLLTRGIDENGQLRPSPEQAPELYKESPLGLIPREWNYRQVISVANTYAGGTPSRNIPGFFGDEVPWVKSTEVNQESISSTEEKITELGLSKSSAKWVPEGTPLVAMYGATAGMVSWLTIRATTNQAVLAVVPSGNQCGRWIYWALTWSSSRLLASVQGSGQPNLSKGTIDALAMSVPKQSEQVLIANILDQHISRLASEKKYLMKIKAQKTALMDDLLTGRVRVTPLLDQAQAQATTPA